MAYILKSKYWSQNHETETHYQRYGLLAILCRYFQSELILSDPVEVILGIQMLRMSDVTGLTGWGKLWWITPSIKKKGLISLRLLSWCIPAANESWYYHTILIYWSHWLDKPRREISKQPWAVRALGSAPRSRWCSPPLKEQQPVRMLRTSRASGAESGLQRAAAAVLRSAVSLQPLDC